MIGVGQTLGNYHVVAKLGSGGMGAVYMAEHPLIGKKVALKVIHRELAMNREVVTRFFNEARAVNQIGNEHIVDISDFGQTPEGEYFFIMELLSGKSLGEVLAKERVMVVPRALHIAAQIADALAASHTVGIIHRDLKPDNVFLIHKLGETNFVKILDFGLAKLVAEGGGMNLTQRGVILGTPQYMSPEQCESKKDVDGRTDIYSVGILLYQMITGVIPFDGGSMGEVLVKQVAQPVPPPRGLNPQIPPAVEQIVLRCLAKRPEGRFQTMHELHAALLDPDRFLAGALGPQAKTQFMSAPGQSGAQMAVAATMMVDAPARPSGRISAPRQVVEPAPPIHEAKTMFLGQGSTPSAPALAAIPATEDAPRASRAFPAMQAPAPVSSSTVQLTNEVAMGVRGVQRAATRRRWIVGILLGATLAGATVAIGLVATRRRGEPGRTSTPAPAAPEPAVTPAVATLPVETPPADPAPAGPVVSKLAPATVRIAITSDPAGAEVFDETAERLIGTTPTEVTIPRDEEHVLRFRHPECGEKKKAVRAENDTELMVELLRVAKPPAAAPPAQRPRPRPQPPKPKPPRRENDIERAIDEDTILEPSMD